MKKVALSLATVLAAAAFAPEASALPVFARQTGMACSACHFQHFPALNGFGRAFKSSGYTLMGAQGKVEGEHLSIPDRLNMAVLTTWGWEHASGANQNPAVALAVPNTPATGTQIHNVASGGELSLFYGGRVSENVGFLSELALTSSTVVGTNAAKLPILFEVAEGLRVGLVPMSTAGQGAAHSLELLNTGAAATHRMAPMAGANSAHINVNSASQYLGTKGAADGASVVVVSDKFFVNAGLYGLGAPAGPGVAASSKNLNAKYLRAAMMLDVAGFDTAFGIQSFGGSDVVNADATQATVFDLQMQGDVGMPLGVYASYGSAKAGTGGKANAFNLLAGGAGGKNRTSFNVGAELGVIPGSTTVMAAFRMGKNGGVDAAGAALSDNGIMIAATYELAMNVELSVSHTTQSGSAWNAANAGPNPAFKKVTTVMMEAVF